MTDRQMLTPAEVSEQLGMTTAALSQMRFRGTGPLFLKLGRKSVRYRQADIDDWVNASVRRRTDERPPAA